MNLKAVLTAAMLLVPTAALAAPGIVTESAGLRAGPGRDFPLVDRIPGGSRVNIHGCLRGYAWCDVSWSDDRGWVSSEYLDYLYRNSYVYLPDYVDDIDVPVVPFVLSSYWASYYEGRPWYHRQAYWTNYWTSHERFATRLTIDQSAARIGRTAARNASIAEGRTPRAGATERTTTGQSAAQSRATSEAKAREAQGRAATAQARAAQETQGRAAAAQARSAREAQGRAAAAQARSAREAQGRAAAAQARMAHEQARVAHENRAARANARMQPMERARAQAPAARAHEAAPRVAQPNVNRAPNSAPMGAHAQMPAQHAAPAMPHAAPAMPHAAAPAAPHGGGGGPGGGGGHGREQH